MSRMKFPPRVSPDSVHFVRLWWGDSKTERDFSTQQPQARFPHYLSYLALWSLIWAVDKLWNVFFSQINICGFGSPTLSRHLIRKGSFCGWFEKEEKTLFHYSYVHLITVLRLTVNPSLSKKYWGGCRGCHLLLTSLHLSTCSPSGLPMFFYIIYWMYTHRDTPCLAGISKQAGMDFLSSNWFCHTVLHLQNKTIDWESWVFSVAGEKYDSREPTFPSTQLLLPPKGYAFDWEIVKYTWKSNDSLYFSLCDWVVESIISLEAKPLILYDRI